MGSNLTKICTSDSDNYTAERPAHSSRSSLSGPMASTKKPVTKTQRIGPDFKGAGSHAKCEGWVVIHEFVEPEKNDIVEDDDSNTDSEC